MTLVCSGNKDFFFLPSNLCTQCGTQTHKPWDQESHALTLSQPGAPERKIFNITWYTYKIEAQVADLVSTLLLSSRAAIIEIEAHTLPPDPDYQGHATATFHAKAPTQEIPKVPKRKINSINGQRVHTKFFGKGIFLNFHNLWSTVDPNQIS